MLTNKQFETYHRAAAILVTGIMFLGISLSINTLATQIFVTVITYIATKMILKKNRIFFKGIL